MAWREAPYSLDMEFSRCRDPRSKCKLYGPKMITICLSILRNNFKLHPNDPIGKQV
jgi:hypothetical protein